MAIRRVSPRIISLDIVPSGKNVSLISVYTLQSGRSEKEKDQIL